MVKSKTIILVQFSVPALAYVKEPGASPIIAFPLLEM